ncbi:MAG: S41 family peptidase [Saprospiraceae bacterium]
MKKITVNKRYWLLPVVALAAFGIATTTIKEDNKYFEISKNIEIFTNLYKEINTFYVDDLDPSKIMRTGIDAMLESLDPYTNYISEAEIEGFTMTVRGKYSGIGATINRNPGDIYPFVTNPYEGFPAQKAGIKAGDFLLEVDGKSTKGKSTNDISEILRGATGSGIELKLKRPITNKEYTVNVTRGEVKIPNVPYYGMLNDEVGYLTLTTFTEDAGKNVANAVRELKKNTGLKGIVFDLRGNGGGLLIEAVNVSNVFIGKNELVAATRGKVKDRDKNFSTLNAPVDLDIPVTVLIDEGSASASEIVSGVLQDLDRAVLVGQKSYGKGLVQNTRDVGFNSRVKMTIAKYYIPSGRCIQAVSYKDGEPIEIPDSLKAKFKTRNGRMVYDGGGIYPDVKIKGPAKAAGITVLLRKNLIFDYATQYFYKNPSIADAKSFSLTDADYDDFVKFVQESGKYTYSTKSEKALKNLESKAKKENYLGEIQGEINAMKQKMVTDKSNDLRKYKKEIKDLLEREVASRYYYVQGKIQVSLKNDEEVAKAIEVLQNTSQYKSLLQK